MVAWSLLPRSGGPLPFDPAGRRVLVALGEAGLRRLPLVLGWLMYPLSS